MTGSEAATLHQMAAAIPAPTQAPLVVIIVESKGSTAAPGKHSIEEIERVLQLDLLRELPTISSTHTVNAP
jgi:hypothetical protein